MPAWMAWAAVFGAEQRAQGNAAGEGFGEGDDVGHDAVVLVRAEFCRCGPCRTGSHRPMSSAPVERVWSARGVQKFAGRGDESALTLNGLQQDRAEFAGEFCFQVVDVVKTDEFDPRHHGIEGLAVLVFPCGGDRAHGAAVEAVFKREELGAEGVPRSRLSLARRERV